MKAANEAGREKKLTPISTNLVLYCARHTFGTDMLGEGVKIVELAELLGTPI